MFRKRKEEDVPESVLYRWFGPTFGALALFFLDITQIVVIAAVIILPIRFWVIKPFIVKGASMEDNYYERDYLIIDQLHLKSIERGEVIVFRPPNRTSQHYIKRVIGLPGETVEIEDGIITIYNDTYPNGTELRESYIHEYTHVNEPIHVVLGLSEYYVLGDNRNESLDSRLIGPITEDAIVGRVWLRGLPFERFGTVATPEYDY
jgi:signal peptidase I